MPRSFRFAVAAFAALVAVPAASQTFTPVTTGDAVNDQRYSEGASWRDVDGDGRLDLFVANIVGQDNLLFRGDGAGNLVAADAAPATTDGGFSYGGCLADFDNDGDPDLYVVNGGASQSAANFLYRNDGGVFLRITTGAAATDVAGSWSAAPADYDLDGDLDLFVANFNQDNALYRNDGGLVFTAITTGPVVTDGGPSLGSSWSDYDGDGDPDLFVFNADFATGVPNLVYRNDGGGAFVRDLSFPLGTASRNSVSGAWGDVDNDGDLDLVVANYSNQNNQLFRNDGGGVFVNGTAASGIGAGGSSVCPAFADTDNDGLLDLFLSNDNNGDNHLFRNAGGGVFTAVAAGAIVSDGGRSNASVWADPDGDGDLDLYVTNGDQPVAQSNFLYRNDGPAGNHLRVRCVGTVSNRDAIGARVRVLATIGGGPVRQLREISGQTGYNAQGELVAHFGLGDATFADSVVVEWPRGLVEAYAGVPAGSITLTEGPDPTASPIAPAARAGAVALGRPVPDPFPASTSLDLSLPAPGRVTVSLHDVMGRRVRTLFEGYSAAPSRRVTVDGEGLAAGVYFVVARTEGGSAAAPVHLIR